MHRPDVGLSGVAGVLPPLRLPLKELARRGLLVSSCETLSGFGFGGAHLCDDENGPEILALQAARQALQEAALDPRQVDALIWASARPECHVRRVDAGSSCDAGLMDGFRYSAGWLQHEMGLERAEVMAVAQQGCSTMFSALRLARSLLISEPGWRHVLCVGADALPAGAPREILYNVISDGACATVVSRDHRAERWLGSRQVSRGYYWDPVKRRAEILAAYFPMAQRVIQGLLSDHGVRPGEVDHVIPTGVNHASWEILLRLVGIPTDRLYRGEREFGHTTVADNFLYLEEFRRHHAAGDGSRLLLFTYGFGSSWSALLLEH